MNKRCFRVPAVGAQPVFFAHCSFVAGDGLAQVFDDDLHLVAAGVDDGVGVVGNHDVARQVEQVAARQLFGVDAGVVRFQVFFLQVAVARDVIPGAAVAPLGECRAVEACGATSAPNVAASQVAARGGDDVAGQVGGGGVAAVQPAAIMQLQVVAFFGGDGQAGVGRQGGAVGAFQVGRGGDGGDGEGDVRP